MPSSSATNPKIKSKLASSASMQAGGATVNSPTKGTVRLESWVPPSLAWSTEPDAFCIEVPVNDSDVVEFLATGVLDCAPSHSSRYKTAAIAGAVLINGRDSLRGQLAEAVWDRAKLKSPGSWVKAGTKVEAHCLGVFVLPGEKSLCVLVGRKQGVAPNRWISEKLKGAAEALLAKHQAEVDQHNEKERLRRENWDSLRAKRPDLPEHDPHIPEAPPILTGKLLLPLLPRAVTFQYIASANSNALTR